MESRSFHTLLLATLMAPLVGSGARSTADGGPGCAAEAVPPASAPGASAPDPDRSTGGASGAGLRYGSGYEARNRGKTLPAPQAVRGSDDASPGRGAAPTAPGGPSTKSRKPSGEDRAHATHDRAHAPQPWSPGKGGFSCEPHT